jgi:hypothetical protein
MHGSQRPTDGGRIGPWFRGGRTSVDATPCETTPLMWIDPVMFASKEAARGGGRAFAATIADDVARGPPRPFPRKCGIVENFDMGSGLGEGSG